jgi:hypothetical protein
MACRLKAGIDEQKEEADAMQQRGKCVSAAKNKHTTIERAVFSMRPLLINGAANTCPWQRMNAQHSRSRWRLCLVRGPCTGYIMRTS